MLNVREKVLSDDSITNIEYRSYQSYVTGDLKHNDECRIVIQQQGLITAPGESYLHIQGKLLKHDSTGVVTKCELVNNFIAFLFEEIRLELGGVVVDRVTNPGITTSMKNYVSLTPNESNTLLNAGWCPLNDDEKFIDSKTGTFDICWPLSSIFGFCEDFKKVLINLRQELILVRSTDDLNATIEKTGLEKGKIVIDKISWRVPHYRVSDQERLKRLDLMDIERRISVPIVYRRWELFTIPVLQKAHSFSWPIKLSSNLEKPRFIIFGLQIGRKNNLKTDPSHFDHCKLQNIKLFLNSEAYPNENLNLHFEQNQYALAYDMYAKFQQAYYFGRKLNCEALLNTSKYKDIAPLIVIDCSHQNESLNGGSVDVRLDFDTHGLIGDDTSAFCLVLHEQKISYEPSTGRVSQVLT